MIEVKDKKTLEILNKKFNFGLAQEGDDIYTPGFAIKGKKGYGTTSFTFTNFPGSQLVFSYDGQSQVIKQEMEKKDPSIKDRITIIDLYSSVFKDITISDKSLLEVGYKICNYVLSVIPLVEADHIVHERIPILNQRAEEYARYLHFGDYDTSLMAPATGPDMRMWGYRNRFYDQLVALSFAHSNICPVITTYPSKDYGNIFKGQKSEDPEWEINIMSHFRDIVDIKRVKDQNKGYRYYALFESMKESDFGVTGDEFDITGNKVILPPEKFERYRKGNPFNEIKDPVNVPHLNGEGKIAEKDIDTARENLEHAIDEKKDDLLDL